MKSRVLKRVGELLDDLDMTASPPENAVVMYALIADLTGIRDPYRKLRRQSNQFALNLLEEVSTNIRKSHNTLRAALHYSAAANIIDYGTDHEFDAREVLSACRQKDFAVDNTQQLMAELEKRKTCRVLYLADNSGELVFDGLLVKELQKRGCEVTIAVREKEILNDATMQDAVSCGIDKICPVITNGTGCPGTPFDTCSKEFRNLFRRADCIISKGQGNFETLTEVEAPVYFLLTVKCPVVGRHIEKMNKNHDKTTIEYGDMVLMKRRG